tara:strand:- start:504 stop:1112 length:609 start_codon:yes stop_codon:yes gene_type:complete
MIKLNLFSKVVLVDNLNLSSNHLKELNQKARKEKYVDAKETYSTKISKSLYVLDNLNTIKKIILNKFLIINNDYFKYNSDFKITTSWFTKSSKNNLGNFHNHGNNFYSGIYYIDVDDDTGDIEFSDFTPSSYVLDKKEFNIDNSKSWRLKPKNDLIVFFPSETYHQIHLNKSENDRYSLAFNIFPIGRIGYGDNIIDTSKVK